MNGASLHEVVEELMGKKVSDWKRFSCEC